MHRIHFKMNMANTIYGIHHNLHIMWVSGDRLNTPIKTKTVSSTQKYTEPQEFFLLFYINTEPIKLVQLTYIFMYESLNIHFSLRLSTMYDSITIIAAQMFTITLLI
jgi:hypothetical protein